jgi:hypothetical protein
MITRASIHVRLRRRPASKPAKHGSSRTIAVVTLPAWATEEVGMTAVLIVSVFVAVPAAEVKATEGVAKLQEKYGGRVPQAKFMAPAKPPCDVTVKVTVPECANGIVRLVGFAVAVKPGTTTVSVRGADVLAVKFASPAYVAVMVSVPVVLKEVVSVATPPASVPVPREVVPL